MTLTDFLLARIAEDEAEASQWPTDGQWGPHPYGGMWMDTTGRPIYAPRARVLAECEAKRRIVEMQWHHFGEDDYAWGMEEAKRQILAVLALPYADHPDYREEWRP